LLCFGRWGDAAVILLGITQVNWKQASNPKQRMIDDVSLHALFALQTTLQNFKQSYHGKVNPASIT